MGRPPEYERFEQERAWPIFREQPGPVSGCVGTPGSSAYLMSKLAVRGLAESLVYELTPQGIAVTAGFVESEIRQVDHRGRWHPEAVDPAPRWLVMRAETVARQIVCAAARRRREVVITAHCKVIVWLRRYAPWFLAVVIRRFGLPSRERALMDSDELLVQRR